VWKATPASAWQRPTVASYAPRALPQTLNPTPESRRADQVSEGGVEGGVSVVAHARVVVVEPDQYEPYGPHTKPNTTSPRTTSPMTLRAL